MRLKSDICGINHCIPECSTHYKRYWNKPQNISCDKLWNLFCILKIIDIDITALWIPVVKPTRCTSFSNYLFLHNTLHVSEGLSVHHQEFRTVHTATGICQTDRATREWEGISFHLVPFSKRVTLSVWHMPVAVCTVLNSWWWTERPHETCRELCKNK
jgi:hypothetical protein